MDYSETNVRLSGKLVCGSDTELDLLKRYLDEHKELSRAEEGCISFDVIPTDDPFVWQVEECFVDREAFEFHQKRTKASEWGLKTTGIRREYEVTGLE